MARRLTWSLTTITFRSRLCSLEDLAAMARRCGFKGIELWEPHWRDGTADVLRWRTKHPSANLVAFSAYLDFTDASPSSADWSVRLEKKMQACRALGIPVLRLFTGTTPSWGADASTWELFFERLQHVQATAEAYGVDVAFETHPGTLLDTADGVDALVGQVRKRQWSRIGINFDAFHVWEFEPDVASCLERWYGCVRHVHLKNARGRTDNFTAANVFFPTGKMDDLASLKDGVLRVDELVELLFARKYAGAVTVEWFGCPDEAFLKGEVEFLNRCCRHGASSLHAAQGRSVARGLV